MEHGDRGDPPCRVLRSAEILEFIDYESGRGARLDDDLPLGECRGEPCAFHADFLGFRAAARRARGECVNRLATGRHEDAGLRPVKVLMRTNYAGPMGMARAAGEIIDLPPASANALIAGRFAEAVATAATGDRRADDLLEPNDPADSDWGA